jgi:5-methylthioadenosine/S-adenosylhomocysteine deaminase
MENGITPGMDFASLPEAAQAAGEQATLQDWDPLGRTHEEVCPWCYAMDG